MNTLPTWSKMLLAAGMAIVLVVCIDLFTNNSKNNTEQLQVTTGNSNTLSPTADQQTAFSAQEKERQELEERYQKMVADAKIFRDSRKELDVYWGTYENRPTLYSTWDKDTSRGYVYSDSSSAQVSDTRPINISTFKKVATFTREEIFNTEYPTRSFFISPTGNTLYLLFLVYKPGGNVNLTYSINLQNLTREKIYEYSLVNEKYTQRGSLALLSVFNDKYLNFRIDPCYECDGGFGANVLLVNAVTKKEKYLPNGYVLSVAPETNTFSYQKYAYVQEPCLPEEIGGDIGLCVGKKAGDLKTVYKPTGTIFSEILP